MDNINLFMSKTNSHCVHICVYERIHVCVTHLFRPVTWLRYQRKRRPTAVELNSPGKPVTMVRTFKLYFRKILALFELYLFILNKNKKILQFYLKMKCIDPQLQWIHVPMTVFALGRETDIFSLVPRRCQHDRETMIIFV